MSQHSRTVAGGIILLLLFSMDTAVVAFTIPTDAMTSGGGSSSSVNYKVLDAIGQPMPAGTAASIGYANEAGYIGTLIGTGRLLPSIGFSPPGFTFTTVVGVNPATQSLSLINSGGGSLAWSLNGGSWLTFSPFFGSGNGGSQVGANVVGLTAGSYSDSISVVGEGASNSPVSIPVNLTVKAGYTLSIAISGTGGGSVTVTPPGMVCNTNCDIDVPPPGATALIHATPDQYSLLGSMSGACSGSGDCSAAMTMDKGEEIIFTRDTVHMARVLEQIAPGNPTTGYYGTMQAAYGGAATGNTIQAWGVEFTENLALSSNTTKSVSVKGGYNGAYGSNGGQTTNLRGSITVINGAVTLENITVR